MLNKWSFTIEISILQWAHANFVIVFVFIYVMKSHPILDKMKLDSDDINKCQAEKVEKVNFRLQIMEATQFNLTPFWDDWLQVCYYQISWAAYFWELLKWAVGALFIAFAIHYCWYEFVWRRLTRIPDDARAPRQPRKRLYVNDGDDMKGVLCYRERREKLALIESVGDFLEALELFGYFEHGARDTLKGMARDVLVKQGDSIPDSGHDFYILKQGRVKVYIDNESEELMELMVTLPGSPVTSLFNIAVAMVGDDSTVTLPRLCTFAEEDSICVVLPAAAFRAIKERIPLQAKTMV